jgi:carboxymethylenebutenolidase
MGGIEVPHFLARPDRDAPWPGVVVIHEGNGISPQLLRVCERLAGEGYAVIAPDLFWRQGGSDPGKAIEALGLLKLDEVRSDVAFALSRLRETGASKIGITGFCFGGRISYLASLWDLGIECAAPFYGAGIGSYLDSGRPGCPLLLFFGERDEYIPNTEVEDVKSAYPGQVVVYPEAGHGFMRDGSESYREAAATDAWNRLLTFLNGHLR